MGRTTAPQITVSSHQTEAKTLPILRPGLLWVETISPFHTGAPPQQGSTSPIGLGAALEKTLFPLTDWRLPQDRAPSWGKMRQTGFQGFAPVPEHHCLSIRDTQEVVSSCYCLVRPHLARFFFSVFFLSFNVTFKRGTLKESYGGETSTSSMRAQLLRCGPGVLQQSAVPPAADGWAAPLWEGQLRGCAPEKGRCSGERYPMS